MLRLKQNYKKFILDKGYKEFFLSIRKICVQKYLPTMLLHGYKNRKEGWNKLEVFFLKLVKENFIF